MNQTFNAVETNEIVKTKSQLASDFQLLVKLSTDKEIQKLIHLSKKNKLESLLQNIGSKKMKLHRQSLNSIVKRPAGTWLSIKLLIKSDRDFTGQILLSKSNRPRSTQRQN